MFEIEVIDNFLDKKHFEKIKNIKLERINPDEVKVYHNEIIRDEIRVNNGMNKELLIELNKRYHSIALDLLKKLSPQKLELYEYSDFTLINTGSNYKFPIHDDTPNKLLSGVIYISPEFNNGTFFYENKKLMPSKIIEWKQNRAVFFSRIEKKTWHSYEGNKISNRVALVYNLMTNNIKRVCQIEKKNYYKSLIRFKLNPYLYRFLKFTI